MGPKKKKDVKKDKEKASKGQKQTTKESTAGSANHDSEHAFVPCQCSHCLCCVKTVKVVLGTVYSKEEARCTTCQEQKCKPMSEEKLQEMRDIIKADRPQDFEEQDTKEVSEELAYLAPELAMIDTENTAKFRMQLKGCSEVQSDHYTHLAEQEMYRKKQYTDYWHEMVKCNSCETKIKRMATQCKKDAHGTIEVSLCPKCFTDQVQLAKKHQEQSDNQPTGPGWWEGDCEPRTPEHLRKKPDLSQATGSSSDQAPTVPEEVQAVKVMQAKSFWVEQYSQGDLAENGKNLLCDCGLRTCIGLMRLETLDSKGNYFGTWKCWPCARDTIDYEKTILDMDAERKQHDQQEEKLPPGYKKVTNAGTTWTVSDSEDESIDENVVTEETGVHSVMADKRIWLCKHYMRSCKKCTQRHAAGVLNKHDMSDIDMEDDKSHTTDGAVSTEQDQQPGVEQHRNIDFGSPMAPNAGIRKETEM